MPDPTYFLHVGQFQPKKYMIFALFSWKKQRPFLHTDAIYELIYMSYTIKKCCPRYIRSILQLLNLDLWGFEIQDDPQNIFTIPLA